MSGIAFAVLMEAVLEKNVPFRFTASGSSMTPFIRDGDILTISPVSLRLRRGDVVPFVNPSSNQLMVHRILDVSREGYLIKGDNNSIPDEDRRSSPEPRVKSRDGMSHRNRH